MSDWIPRIHLIPEYASRERVSNGALWEDGLLLSKDQLLTLFNPSDGVGDRPCPHSMHIHTLHFSSAVNDSVWSESLYICPRVLVAYNEGGMATTGVCLDCIIGQEWN